jgi:hypothetical protein
MCVSLVQLLLISNTHDLELISASSVSTWKL